MLRHPPVVSPHIQLHREEERGKNNSVAHFSE